MSLVKHDRFDEEWVEWRCVDCDPEHADPEEPDDVANDHDAPYAVLVPKGDPAPDICPRCGSYLSFTEGAERLRVTNTPGERWAKKHEAEANQ